MTDRNILTKKRVELERQELDYLIFWHAEQAGHANVRGLVDQEAWHRERGEYLKAARTSTSEPPAPRKADPCFCDCHGAPPGEHCGEVEDCPQCMLGKFEFPENRREES